MVAAVLWRRFIRKDFVESHIVLIDSITRWTTNDQVVWIPQIADQSSDSDIDYVISKAPAVGPTAWNEPTVVEGILNVTLQDISAEDAET